jgi:hypothetical protein
MKTQKLLAYFTIALFLSACQKEDQTLDVGPEEYVLVDHNSGLPLEPSEPSKANRGNPYADYQVLDQVSANIRNNRLINFTTTANVFGKVKAIPHYAQRFYYNSWILVYLRSRIRIPFKIKPSDKNIIFKTEWAGWGDITKVDIIVNGNLIEKNVSVSGSAWSNPGEKYFEVPNHVLNQSGNNTFAIRLNRKSRTVLFLKSISILQKNQTRVNVLAIDGGEHGKKVVKVFKSDKILFPLNENISIHLTNDFDDFNPNNVQPVDIVSKSSGTNNYRSGIEDFNKLFKDASRFPTPPLVITSAGNSANTCTERAYNFAKTHGSLSAYDIFKQYDECDISAPRGGENCPDEALSLFNACDMIPAYAVKETDFEEHFIVVGRSTASMIAEQPGSVLKNIFINAPSDFTFEDGQRFGATSSATPYVAKVAAEIKRRGPHYTHQEIKQLIFSTADDLGVEGVDEVFGNGFINPSAAFKELSRRGY